MAQERILYIDFLKGITIILVVVGHVIQYYLCPQTYLNDFVFRYIYGFHLQLFVLLSGLTIKQEIFSLEELKNKIIKRFRQLLIPFFTWTLLSSLVLWDASCFLDVLLHPGRGLWFLWDLFFISFFFYIAIYISKIVNCPKLIAIIGVFLLLVIISVLAGESDTFDIKRIMRLFPFLVLGTYIKEDRFRLFFMKKTVILVLIIAYTILAIYWYPNGFPEQMRINTFFGRLLSSFPYRLIVSLIGCLMAFSFGNIFAPFKGVSFLNYIGTKTLGIYAIHLFVVLYIALPLINGFSITYSPFNLLIITLLLVLLSIFLIRIIEMNKLTRLLLLGNIH